MIKYSDVKIGIEEVGRDGVESVIADMGADIIEPVLAEGSTLGDIKNAIDNHNADIVKSAIYLGIALDDIDDCYQGSYSSHVEFAQEMADQLGAVDKNATWPQTCIDWDYAAKELMYDYSEENGHYFRNI